MDRVSKVENRKHVKDPAAVKDWRFDWREEWLSDGEAIESFEVTAYDGIGIDSAFNDGEGGIVVWLSGGTVGRTYRVTCEIVTDQGRTDRRSMEVRVRNL